MATPTARSVNTLPRTIPATAVSDPRALSSPEGHVNAIGPGVALALAAVTPHGASGATRVLAHQRSPSSRCVPSDEAYSAYPATLVAPASGDDEGSHRNGLARVHGCPVSFPRDECAGRGRWPLVLASCHVAVPLAPAAGPREHRSPRTLAACSVDPPHGGCGFLLWFTWRFPDG